MGWPFDEWWLEDWRSEIAGMGLIVPSLFLVNRIVNIITGTVRWPAGRLLGNAADGLLFRYTDIWRIGGLQDRHGDGSFRMVRVGQFCAD